ncbi:MAG: sigma-70 family RNA polymerase sigma factor [Planctomycetota bacterium]
MPRVPETRASLILRLPSTADAEAWREFVSIYEPFVYRFARRGALQDADARELVQNVLLAVARAVGRWRPDGDRGKFRTWLFRIARNQLIDLLGKRRRQAAGRGGTSFLGVLDQQPALDGWSDEDVKLSHRRELFRWAAERVKGTVKEATWRAFWLTAVEDRPVDDVAHTLGLSTGAVYIARSRVLARLRDEVKRWEDDNDAL